MILVIANELRVIATLGAQNFRKKRHILGNVRRSFVSAYCDDDGNASDNRSYAIYHDVDHCFVVPDEGV
jgi:hypothetical protein